MGKVKFLVFLSLIFIFREVRSQQVDVPNLSGILLPENYSFFNVAAPLNEKAILYFDHNRGLGPFKVFQQNYFSSRIQLKNDSLRSQSLGVRVINEKAGPYISLSRVSVPYSYHLTLSSEMELGLGFAPSLINYKKEAQTFGGSEMKFNFDIGTWMKIKSFHFGYSVNQLLPQSFQIISQVESPEVQHYLFCKKGFVINPDFSLEFAGSIQRSKETNLSSLGGTFLYSNRVRFGVNYEFSRNMIWFMALENTIISGSNKLDLFWSFAIPSFHKTFKPRNTIEGGIGYKF